MLKALKENLAMFAWDVLVRLGGRSGDLAIYGFGNHRSSWNRKLAGKIMCSSWWPVEGCEDEH